MERGRQRWIGRVSLVYFPNGKRRVATVSGRTKAEARARLREVLRDQEDGVTLTRRDYTVADAVEGWLEHGLVGRSVATVTTRENLARNHLLPELGSCRLVELSAEDVEQWLARRSPVLSTDTVQRLLGMLRAVIRRAQAREYVRRNVALLCDPPKGRAGRPSKSLTLDEAHRLILAAEGTSGPMRAYVVVSLLTGARTEELRALTWDRVHLDGVPVTVDLWRSVRADGEMKTRTSRRTLEIPVRCAEVLRSHRVEQLQTRMVAGGGWEATDLVFTTSVGTALDAANVRRAFRRVVEAAGLDESAWTPRELRHSFVSILSSSGVAIEDISHLVGHASTRVTELVYRKELRPVLTRGAAAMDELFSDRTTGSSVSR